MNQPTIESTHSGTTRKSPYQAPSLSYQHNPYARISSRRAIACVTCAKAKTKCDKALPECSRCITKGIKCEPRSTRRTSDNNYRVNLKKPLVSPKRYHSSSAVPSPSRYTSPRTIPSLKKHRAMRVASNIDFRAAVKMSEQASGISGFPMLTPLPTYSSQIVDEYYPYSSSPEQNLGGFTQAIELNTFPNSGRLTPQTPEPIIYHEPLSMRGNLENYITSQPWSDEAVISCGLDFDPEMNSMLPRDTWSAPEPENIMPMAQTSWPQTVPSVSPPHMSAELVAYTHSMPALSTSECSVEDLDSSGPPQEEWSIYQPIVTNMNLASMVTSATFVHDMGSVPNHAPIWDDGFISGSLLY